jgi:hypothetical protein
MAASMRPNKKAREILHSIIGTPPTLIKNKRKVVKKQVPTMDTLVPSLNG